MERREFARQLVRFIQRNDRFLLSGHVRPDGDAVGAISALALVLQRLGKEAMLVLDGDATRYTSIIAPIPVLPEEAEVQEAGRYFTTGRDFAFVMVDCSEPERTGKAKDAILVCSSSLSIDHHVTNVEACDFTYCEPETSSASEILFYLLKEADLPMDLEVAKALFMGVSYDTGGFRHSNASAATFRMAADLREMGVDTSFFMNYLFYTEKLLSAQCYAQALHNSKLYEDGILVSQMAHADFVKIGAKPMHADGVVGKLTEIEEAKVVCYLREIDTNLIRVNMRSKCEVNVARVAALFGGGGHILAAGCTVSGPMLYAKEELLKAIRLQTEEKEQE